MSSINVVNDGGLGTRLHTGSLSGANTNPSGSVEVFNGMVNALWDFRTGTPFVPYIGIGVGMAEAKLENFSVGSHPLANSTDTVFAYQPMVGVRYHITDGLALGVEYRYFATVDPTFKDSTGVKFSSSIASHNVLANLSYFFGAPPAAPQPVAAPAPPPPVVAPPAPPPVQAFIVYFDTGRATLTPQGRSVADDAVATFKRSNATHVTIAGFTDTVGSARLNEGLSRRRAEAVRDYLVAHGVPLSEMAVNWHGETDLRVPTGNDVPQSQNRRVEIDIP